MSYEFTSLESELLEHAVNDKILDLRLRDDNTIRAEAVRNILLNYADYALGPRGILLQGAQIEGEIDLSDITSVAPLRLGYCSLGSIRLERSNFSFVLVHDSKITSLYADSFNCTHDLNLNNSTFSSTLDLTDAIVGGCLVLDSVKCFNLRRSSAITAARLHVKKATLARDLEVIANGDTPALYLRSAILDGGLALDGSNISNFSGPAVSLSAVRLQSEATMPGLSVRAASELPALDLSGSRIEHRVVVGGEIHNSGGSAVSFQGASIGSSSSLIRLQASAAESGEVANLRGARIKNLLGIDKCVFSSDDAAAIAADRLVVDGRVAIRDSSIYSTAEEGGIKFIGVEVASSVDIFSIWVDSVNGGGLVLQGASVGNRIDLDGYSVIASRGAALEANMASVAGPLHVDNTSLISRRGPALDVVRSSFSDVLIGSGVKAEANTKFSCAILAGITVRGQLAVRGRHFKNKNSEGSLFHLGDSKISGDFEMPAAALGSGSRPRSVLLDGLTYPRIPQGASLDKWLEILKNCTPGYEAQPYRQLAAGHRALGDEGAARRVHIAQNFDRYYRTEFRTRSARILHRLSGFFIGFGYKPWRALGWLLAVFVLSLACTFISGQSGYLITSTSPPVQCNLFAQISLSLPATGPILKAVGSPTCVYGASIGAQAFAISSYVLQVAGWAFVTLFVAGFTGLIRKD